jgi:predicted PurR-regulated permease PerM
MNASGRSDRQSEQRMMSGLMDVLIRAGLVGVMVVLCYQVFAPFLHLTIWAVILAVALYPFHQIIARRLGGRQGLSSTLIVILGAVLIIAPIAVLMGLLADSVQGLIHAVRDNTLKVPAPRDSVAAWPIVGQKIHDMWSLAHSDLPAFVQSLQPKIGDLAKTGLAFVASIGGALLQLVAAFIVAAIIMAFGEAASRASRAIFERIVGIERAGRFVLLSTATIRAVALGVIGVALIQAIIIGMALFVARVPLAGVAAAIMLVLGIAQVPALIVTLPAIAYIWMSGDYGTVEGVAYTIGLVLAGMADNVLKPLLLGRGVDAPMPVILLGALGGMAAAGILGMFVGATLLALGYQIFMLWVAERPHSDPAEAKQESGTAG